MSWLLLQGDFLETMSTAPAPPDLIFYDMFSTKTSGDRGHLIAFRKFFEACAGRAAELFTYTCSTANRAALLAAGFYVARGRNAGESWKRRLRLRLRPVLSHSCRHELLTPDWLEKWHRSGAKFPGEIQAHQHDSFEHVIREHEQFR